MCAASSLSFAMGEIVHLAQFAYMISWCDKAEGESCHKLRRQQGALKFVCG
jgi:hypothetical protein